MPPLDFPSGPAINDTWTGSNGVTYTWNGTMWTVSGSGTGPYLPLSGGTMTGGDITLFRDPTQPLHASPRRYVDNAINLAGNYLGTWSVAANTPNISAGGSISNANYVAVTVNPATPEVVPVGVPGIAGLTVANGDRIIWASGLGTWQILRNAGVTLAAADARYVALAGSIMTGALTLPGNAASALQAVPLQQVPVASSTTPAMDGTATVGAGTTWAKADHIHPTDTSRASVASVTAAAAAAANNAGRNRLHNPRFSINQRGYVSGTALATGIYGHDRWKAGASGCTYTFTQSQPGTTITITAGSLQQIVEAMAAEGGTYTLSWTGTAQGRVNAGAYAASPVTTAGLAVNAAITVEFNAGTLAGVQLEIGSVATPLEKPDPQVDLAKCQRFYQGINTSARGSYSTGANFTNTVNWLVTMRATPTAVLAIVGTVGNLSAQMLTPLNPSGGYFNVSTAAAGDGYAVGSVWNLSADL
jgi:hypothetical protein